MQMHAILMSFMTSEKNGMISCTQCNFGDITGENFEIFFLNIFLGGFFPELIFILTLVLM